MRIPERSFAREKQVPHHWHAAAEFLILCYIMLYHIVFFTSIFSYILLCYIILCCIFLHYTILYLELAVRGAILVGEWRDVAGDSCRVAFLLESLAFFSWPVLRPQTFAFVR